MAISFNTSASNNTSSATAASVTLTIPAGVLAGDVCIICVMAFDGASGGTLSLSSTGTTPTAIDQAQTAQSGGIVMNGGDWYFVASASDAGKVLTATLSGGTNPFWDISLAAYTGASNSTPIDVHGVGTNVGTSATGTTPTKTTGVSGDWALQMCAAAITNGQTCNVPSGTTIRERTFVSGVASVIVDSNASVGAAGTSIGGGVFSDPVAGSTDWWVLFTVGLAPPGGGGPAGTVQPRMTVPVPRRRPVRAVWARISGQAYVAVPAPLQEYQLAPRRKLARAIWRGGSGQAYVAVPAPVQQYRLAPRRKLARAYVQFVPVTTTNAPAVAGVAGTVPVLMVNQTRVIVRHDGRVVRR